MKDSASTNLELVAKCGLYCGNCKKFKMGNCPGCAGNEKASWCKVRSCCIENGYDTCADCTLNDHHECKKLNNFISSIFEVLFRSDRPASIDFIRENGREAYVNLMIDQNRMVIRKQKVET